MYVGQFYFSHKDVQNMDIDSLEAMRDIRAPTSFSKLDMYREGFDQTSRRYDLLFRSADNSLVTELGLSPDSAANLPLGERSTGDCVETYLGMAAAAISPRGVFLASNARSR